MSSPVPTLAGFREIADRYDLILCDVWGVLHDGTRRHVAASEALMRFRALPGERPRRVVLVSNAPRPWRGVQTILDGYGVPREAYDAILTSGDLTRSLIADHPGERVHHLGPERDAGIFEGLDLTLVPASQARRVVCTGLFDDDTETAADYADTLADLRERAVPMICANPDLVVHRGDRLIFCAGSLAALYAELGGHVSLAGKPHRPIYEVASRALPSPPRRTLCIGDGLFTDVKGAGDFGADCLFVTYGIHRDELAAVLGHPANLAAALTERGVRARYMIATLR